MGEKKFQFDIEYSHEGSKGRVEGEFSIPNGRELFGRCTDKNAPDGLKLRHIQGRLRHSQDGLTTIVFRVEVPSEEHCDVVYRFMETSPNSGVYTGTWHFVGKKLKPVFPGPYETFSGNEYYILGANKTRLVVPRGKGIKQPASLALKQVS